MFDNIKEWTTAKERLDVARRHGIKTRATISNILTGRNKNVPLLEDLTKLAEDNMAKQEELKRRVQALGSNA